MVVSEVCSLLTNTTDDAELLKNKYHTIEIVDRKESLQKNAVNLMLHGCQNTSQIAQSILAKSFFRLELVQLIERCKHHQLDGCNNIIIPQGRMTMGKVKFGHSRKVYDILLASGTIPKYNDSFRVDGNKIRNVMSYLQSSLELKPGIVRNVNVAGHTFHSLPVYERGGRSLLSMFQSYKATISNACD